ncbi:(d)CMP kinase [Pendulispora brunnea]|uniref:Cytidylate kinase n=1 Tax=Pendulispora brunnea TaxID=2905690 RepID=A0ABZ2KME3_9BACT
MTSIASGTSRNRPIVAIDGPAGAGKSSVARRLAERLGFVLVDTGALYRTVALAAERGSIAFDDAEGLERLTHSLVESSAIAFTRSEGREPRVLLWGEDVSDAIRTPEIGMGASIVSAHPGVRAGLLDLQRKLGEGGGVVLEGRDIGTVVFPDAEVKFFLTASPEVRATRRYEELLAKGQSVTFEGTLEEVKKRDAQDMNRAHAPLRRAPTAILIDSSDNTVDETVSKMADLVQAHITQMEG